MSPRSAAQLVDDAKLIRKVFPDGSWVIVAEHDRGLRHHAEDAATVDDFLKSLRKEVRL